MIDLYVFRHGQTDWNKEKRFQGHTDIHLNPEGVQQAQMLTKKIVQLRAELILSSDLTRAAETANIANQESQLSILKFSELREIRIGEPEGMTLDEIKKKYTEESWAKWISFSEEFDDFRFPGGESKKEMMLRLLDLIEGFVSENRHIRKIAISTHGGCIYRMMSMCEEKMKDSVYVANCSLHHFQLTKKTKKSHSRLTNMDPYKKYLWHYRREIS
jgi:probable phosphoglycerate mutase